MPSPARSATSRWIWALAPMSMPRVGSSRISSRGSVISQRARSTFCWLPPERLRMSSVRVGRPDVQRGDPLRDELVVRAPRQRPRPAAAGLQGEHDVVAHGEVADDALALAVLRAERDPRGDGVDAGCAAGWAGRRRRRCRNRRGRRRTAAGPARCARSPSSPASPSTSPGCTARSTGAMAPVRPSPVGGEHRRVGQLGDVGGRLAVEVGERGQLLADHLLHHLQPRELGERVLADQLAVAQDRDAVGDRVDLVEEVRDEQHRHPGVADVADHPEQLAPPRRRRGWRWARRG